MMLLTSLKLTSLVLLIVPAVIVPIIVLGRRLRVLSRENQDQIAASSGNASEALLSVQTVQAFTHEAPSRAGFAGFTEAAYDAARKRIGTRAVMTVIVIFLVFAGVVGVLWRSVCAKACGPVERRGQLQRRHLPLPRTPQHRGARRRVAGRQAGRDGRLGWPLWRRQIDHYPADLAVL